MGRIAGRNGRILVALTSGGTAEPVQFMTNWSMSQTVDKIDVTAFGDTTKTYVAGLPDASGDVTGFFDTATPQLYTAATDGLARKTYLYPDYVNNQGIYFFGTAIHDFSIDIGVDGAAAVSGSWAAASSFAKVG